MFLPDEHTLATGGSGPREASSDVARISNRWYSRALLRPSASVIFSFYYPLFSAGVCRKRVCCTSLKKQKNSLKLLWMELHDSVNKSH